MRWRGKLSIACGTILLAGPYFLVFACFILFVVSIVTGLSFLFLLDLFVSECESVILCTIPWPNRHCVLVGLQDAPLRGVHETKNRPVGEVVVYPSKVGDTEYDPVRLPLLRKAAKIHYTVRKAVEKEIKIGMSTIDLVERVENGIRSSCIESSLRRGPAFPVGVSVNEIAAHHTPNPGDPLRYLEYGDVASLDFGVHMDGHLVDCAFSFAFDSRHDGLLDTVKAATNEGLKHVGIDARVAEIGGYINEVMEAGEVFWPNGKVWQVNTIKNLTGHLIEPFKIHAGKSLPPVNTGENTKMKEGELWAVETFGSYRGIGYVRGRGDGSHYMMKHGDVKRQLLCTKGNELRQIIDRQFSTLAFCPRWFPRRWTNNDTWRAPLTSLIKNSIVVEYPPLCEIPGAFTAQYEHTVFIKANAKEILTRGEDY